MARTVARRMRKHPDAWEFASEVVFDMVQNLLQNLLP